MPFKYHVKIQTNIDERELNTRQLKQIIQSLELAYKNIRRNFYTYFLGRRSFTLALILIVVNALFYISDHDMFYIYAMLVTTLAIMGISIFMAERVTYLTKKEVLASIDHLKERLDFLKKQEEIKATLKN